MLAWDCLIGLDGQYIHLSGFELRNGDVGIYLEGPHNTASNLNVHHMAQSGIAAKGDYSIVEDSKVWWTASKNCRLGPSGCPAGTVIYPNGGWASALAAGRDKVSGITDYAILRRNTVYNNWGEGINSLEANGTIVEDNVVYDNWATNTYIDTSTNVLFQRNLVYVTPGNVFNQAPSLSLADETASKPRTNNTKIINNIFVNGRVDAFSWTIVEGSGLTNALIANNTFSNSEFATGSVNSNNRIMNNIFTGGGDIPSASGLIFSNNLWQGNRPTNAVGKGDVFGDPLLTKKGTIAPGKLTADYAKISSAASPAINHALVLPEVTSDYFKTSRGNSPDIGSYEFLSSAPAPTPAPAVDTQAPKVEITASVTGPTVAGYSPVTIIATASDNRKLVRVNFYVNGTLVCTQTNAPYRCSRLVRKTRNPIINIQVKAYDAARNVGSSNKITLTLK